MMNKTKALTELIMLRNRLQAANSGYKNYGFVEIGDFSYGKNSPMIFHDNSKSTHVKIGKFCSFALESKIICGTNHRADWASTYPFSALIPSFDYIKGHPATKGDIIVGNDVWIGYDATIMSGVTIGDGCVIGARSLVTKSLPSYTICGGTPCHVIRNRFSDSVTQALQEMRWWDWEDTRLVDAIHFLQSSDFDGLIQCWKQSV
jgi:acetyltransferase-like isoleucine patch superfamily enzyme